MAVGSDRDPAAKGSAKDLKVAVGPVHCHFPHLLLSLPCVVLNVVFH